MTNIGPINTNTSGVVGGSFGFGAKPQTKSEEKEKPEVAAKSPEQKSVSADRVLDFMANASMVSAPKTLDPAKYVDSASAERIAGFMADFEDRVAAGLAAFDKEFSGINVSDSTKMTLVLSGLDKEA